MKLWILRPIDDQTRVTINGREVPQWTWDCAYGFVVRATDEKEAREQAYHEAGDEGGDVWLNEGLTSCKPLSTRGEAGVLLRDFLTG
jgi:hypothetical protein